MHKYIVNLVSCQGGFKKAPGYFIFESKEELDAGRVFLRSKEYIEEKYGAVLEAADIDCVDGDWVRGIEAARLVAGGNTEEPDFYKFKAVLPGAGGEYRAGAYIDTERKRLVLCFETLLMDKRFKTEIYFSDLSACICGDGSVFIRAVDKGNKKVAVKLIPKWEKFPF